MSLSGFTSPLWLLLFVVVGGLAAGYVLVTARRKRRLLRFANLPLLEQVAKQPGWERHVPAVLLLASLALFVTGMAGPTAEEKVPRNRATVMLVIDVSLSMEATDVLPTRLKAAQDAATQFAQNMTPGINLGLISFAGTATVLVNPTTDRNGVIKAIENLKLAQSTATGEGIFAALQSVESFSSVVGGADGPPPARIVLMSDGKQTVPEDLYAARGGYTAAQAAKQAGVPISSISFGTTHGSVDIDGKAQPVSVDDESLREIARLSGGDFYKAASAEELKKVYGDLGEQIGYELKDADASKPWVVVGTLILMLGAAASLFFGQRLP
jgi:Ca-activated chloride channel family protein